MQTLHWPSSPLSSTLLPRGVAQSNSADLSKHRSNGRAQKFGGSNMKKYILLFGSAFFLAALPLVAQDDGHSKKPLTCTGNISQDGQSFICEKDHRTWK